MNPRDYTDIRPPADPPTHPCSVCKGEGKLPHDECGGYGWFDLGGGAGKKCKCNDGMIPCYRCDGSGRENA